MFILLSPAKTMRTEPVASPSPLTTPTYLTESQYWVERATRCTVAELAHLYKSSPTIAALNQQRWHTWEQQPLLPAAYAFQGDVYRYLHVDDFTAAQWRFAQQHLRILSGLYGILRPLDAIKPYRLEMGTCFNIPPQPKEKVSAFWQPTLTAYCQTHASQGIINLASQEYSQSIDFKALNCPVITPTFTDNGRVIGVQAKRMRGAMARHLIVHGTTNYQHIQAFQHEGYAFDPHSSTATLWVFNRP